MGIVKAFSKNWYWYWVLLRPLPKIGYWCWGKKWYCSCLVRRGVAGLLQQGVGMTTFRNMLLTYLPKVFEYCALIADGANHTKRINDQTDDELNKCYQILKWEGEIGFWGQDPILCLRNVYIP